MRRSLAVVVAVCGALLFLAGFADARGGGGRGGWGRGGSARPPVKSASSAGTGGTSVGGRADRASPQVEALRQQAFRRDTGLRGRLAEW